MFKHRFKHNRYAERSEHSLNTLGVGFGGLGLLKELFKHTFQHGLKHTRDVGHARDSLSIHVSIDLNILAMARHKRAQISASALLDMFKLWLQRFSASTLFLC